MLSRNRPLTALTAASYLLVVSGAALFHDHACDGHDEHPGRPGVASTHAGDAEHCSVCQFLSQKTAPVQYVTPTHSFALVQSIVVVSPLCETGELFSAWHSRAPPAVA
jgi:hypothetical protein